MTLSFRESPLLQNMSLFIGMDPNIDKLVPKADGSTGGDLLLSFIDSHTQSLLARLAFVKNCVFVCLCVCVGGTGMVGMNLDVCGCKCLYEIG